MLSFLQSPCVCLDCNKQRACSLPNTEILITVLQAGLLTEMKSGLLAQQCAGMFGPQNYIFLLIRGEVQH